MTLTNEEIEALKAKAEAATAGPWTERGHGLTVDAVHPFRNDADGTTPLCFPSGYFDEQKANAAYIAAANPETVLSLISTITQLRARAEAAERERDEAWNAAIEKSAQTVYQWWDDDDVQELCEHICVFKRNLIK